MDVALRANLNPPAYVTDPATGHVTHKFNSRRDAVFPVHTDMNLWCVTHATRTHCGEHES
jgi:hypothetical protein